MYIAAALGVVLAVAGIFVVRPVSVLLGAEGVLESIPKINPFGEKVTLVAVYLFAIKYPT